MFKIVRHTCNFCLTSYTENNLLHSNLLCLIISFSSCTIKTYIVMKYITTKACGSARNFVSRNCIACSLFVFSNRLYKICLLIKYTIDNLTLLKWHFQTVACNLQTINTIKIRLKPYQMTSLARRKIYLD